MSIGFSPPKFKNWQFKIKLLVEKRVGLFTVVQGFKQQAVYK